MKIKSLKNNVDAKCFLNDVINIDSLSSEKMQNISSLKDVKEIIVLPDIHSKPDNPVPTGMSLLTNQLIYPSAIGQGIGCGMRVVKTSLSAKDITSEQVDSVFNSLLSLLRDGTRKSSVVSKAEYKNILTDIVPWLRQECPLESESVFQTDSMQLPSSFPSFSSNKKMRMLPKSAVKKGFETLGTLGGGNHFIELQKISEIYDERVANVQGLKKDDLIFMYHTCSGAFGKRLDDFYAKRYQYHRWDKKVKALFKKAFFHFSDFRLDRLAARSEFFRKKDFVGIDMHTLEAEKFIVCFQAALNLAFANRAIILKFIEQSLKQNLDIPLSLDVIADFAHERIDYERFEDGSFWVHRNGAARVGPKFQDSNIIPLPGFPGGPSFLCSKNTNIKESRFSVNHGAGRNITKQDAKKQFSDDEVMKAFESKKIKLYRKGNGRMSEQAPMAFKDVDQVLKLIEDVKLLNAVAKVEPVAIIKA